MGKICDPPPFRGGQSNGVKYHVSFRYTIYNNNGTVYINYVANPATPISIWGAIQRIGVIMDGNAPRGVEVVGFDSIGSPFTSRHFLVNWDSGTPSALTNIRVVRADGQPDTGGDPPPINCRCTPDSCRIDCSNAPDGFCCIPHALTNQLLQVLQSDKFT